jgi:hypothetical protein
MLEQVENRKRELALIEIIAESFLCGVLFKLVLEDKLSRKTHLVGCEILIIVADLIISPNEGNQMFQVSIKFSAC